jgi:protein SHQ1
MPITPRFGLTQDETRLWVVVHVPHVKVSRESVEVVIEEERRMHFYASPYLLVLTFPHAIYDDEEEGPSKTGVDEEDETVSAATWDPIQGTIRLTLIKKIPQLWPDLDLLANLLQTSRKGASQRKGGGVVQEIISNYHHDDHAEDAPASVGVVESQVSEVHEVASSADELEHEAFLSLMRSRYGDDAGNGTCAPTVDHTDFSRYGFANMFHHVFTDLVREGVVMVELSNPDTTPACDRRRLRQDAEAMKFDPDRYLQDVEVEDDHFYQSAMAMSPHWTITTTTTRNTIANNNDQYLVVEDEAASVDEVTQAMSQLNTNDTPAASASSSSSSHDYFTSDELAKLYSIPYPLLPSTISFSDKMELLLGLLDLLYAYVYDHIMTEGEPTVESSWTVSTLSCSLSWLDVPTIVLEYPSNQGQEKDDDSCMLQQQLVLDVVCASLRRTLIYPYLRNYDLGVHCWKQVRRILWNGRRCILRSLLQLRNVLDKSECHYLGNKLFVDPYLAWLQQPQSVTDQDLEQLEQQLGAILSTDGILTKEKVGLDLIRIEEEIFQSTEDDEEEEDSSDNDTESSSSTASDEDVDDTNQTKDTNNDLVVGEAVQNKEADMSDAKVRIVTDNSLLDMEAKRETKPGMLDQENEIAPVLPARVLIREL